MSFYSAAVYNLKTLQSKIMRTIFREKEEPSGVRLVRLIRTQLYDIVKREFVNNDRVCLYSTGEYWVGFERSAYFLKKAFPRLKTFAVNGHGFSRGVVGVSVHERDVRKLAGEYTVCDRTRDYVEMVVGRYNIMEYIEWRGGEGEI